jgi:hypothetical protein
VKPRVICALLVPYIACIYLLNVRNCNGIICFSVPHVAHALMCYGICPTQVGEMPPWFSSKEKTAGENLEK